ncbi:MAG: porin family protein [Rikenellaceae bacterium]
MMKKILLMTLLLLIGSAAQGQIKLSVKAGTSFNVSDMSYSHHDLLTSHHNPMGFHAGVALKVKLMPMFYIQGDALYNNTNYKFNVTDGGYVKYSYHAIEVPIVAGLQASFFRVYAGPTFSFDLAKHEMKSMDCNTEIDNKRDYNKFGYQVGVGFDIAKKITIDVSYNGKWASTNHTIMVDGANVANTAKDRSVWISVGFFIL